MFTRKSKSTRIRKSLTVRYDHLHSFDDNYHVYSIVNLFADEDTYFALLRGVVDGGELVVEEKIMLLPAVDNAATVLEVAYFADKAERALEQA